MTQDGDRAMAEGSHLIWTLVLLCVFQASDNRQVHGNVHVFIGQTRTSGITPPAELGFTCTGANKQLEQLSSQLQQTALRNSQLDNETFWLRREARGLRLQLAECTSTASAITGSYQVQLQNKMKQLLETFDSDTFQILKIITLTREVSTLQRKLERAANSTETDIDVSALQRELNERTRDLNQKLRWIQTSHANSSLIVEIITLQNQIWDLEQAESRKGETGLQPSRRILALQSQLDQKISELRGGGDAVSLVLELISVHSKISVMERLISVHIKQSRTNAADYQRQWRQLIDLLKKKIEQLNRDESNTDLTQEILTLQEQILRLRLLISNGKKTSDFRLRELRVNLEQEKKKLENLQKLLEEVDYSQAQLTVKIINQMKEVRELQVSEQAQTSASTSQATTLQTLLQAKEREYAKAEAEIDELQRKLRLKSEECSSLEETYEQVKTEFEQRIAELNRTGDSKAALILKVINLHEELQTLRDQISTTVDPKRISELQRQLEEKQEELHSQTADVERLIPNPKIILTIIELQDEIFDLQKKASNNTNSGRVKELQNKVDGLISQIDDRGGENTKLILKVITLQSQLEHLQRQLSGLQTSQAAQITQLRTDLATKTRELQKHVSELNEKNQTSARLILSVTDLHNQLRNLEIERQNDNATSSLTITQLREQLKLKRLEHSRDQAEIRGLQNRLQDREREKATAQEEVRELQRKLKLKSEECSGLEETYEQVKTEFEQKIAELNRTGDSKSALILSVINLHDEQRALRDLISTTKDPKKISELQRELEEKQEELHSKTADVERLIPNPKIILTIIKLQDEIRDLQKQASKTTSDQEKVLQNRLDTLISDLNGRGDGNTKLILKVITLQSQVEHLQRQLSDLQTSQTGRLTQLRNDLATKTGELQKAVNELNEKNQTSARLILSVTDLHNQLRNLEIERQNDNATSSLTITQLREQLKAKVKEHSRDQAEINALQNQLNQTEAQCSGYEQQLKELQGNLDSKIKELQSKSDSVTSLALQVSTLTTQLEELKKQLQNTDSETKIKELQKTIDEKSKELAQKKEELNRRSGQSQRLLQIIAIQTEIEKLSNAAKNDSDYNKITALQDHLNYLIDGIEDEDNEHTKLMFQILAQQDEIARLKKQEERQTQADLQKIKDLERELEDVRNQIKEKTQVLDSSDTRVANLSAQIMELHRKIKPLEEEISDLKEESDERLKELQRKLDLTKRQLQDSETLLKGSDAKNFMLLMEIADLRAQLKKTQKQATKAAKRNIDALEEQLKTQERERRKLETTNKDLKQEVIDLKMCCADSTANCDDIESALKQSQEDADRLQLQLQEKDGDLKQLQQDLNEQIMENNRLQHEYSNLERQQQQTQDNADYLKQQLDEKDARLTLFEKENMKQQDDYDNLLNEKNRLQIDYDNLKDQLSEEEDKTIRARRTTFDPNTANPRIVLSAENTEMSTGVVQNVPDYPGRFDVALAALGSTGYSSGRQYWEVSVAGKRCYQIGMASESSQRKGSISFRPANGFWTVVLDKQGQFKAIAGRAVNIPVQIQPVALGILLDYKKGAISFYDAGARAHMYTFVGQRFSDKIYPFVNFCVDDDGGQNPIVLLSPGTVDWIK